MKKLWMQSLQKRRKKNKQMPEPLSEPEAWTRVMDSVRWLVEQRFHKIQQQDVHFGTGERGEAAYLSNVFVPYMRKAYELYAVHPERLASLPGLTYQFEHFNNEVAKMTLNPHLDLRLLPEDKKVLEEQCMALQQAMTHE